jgi:hypothetical protein
VRLCRFRLTPAIQSRGPWLACGLCCPAGSSLTMASSETLTPSHRLIFFVRRVFALRPRMGWLQELPQFAPRLFSFVPPSVPRQTRRLHMTVASPPALAFAFSAQARHLYIHAHRFPRGRVTRLQSSLYAPAYAAARRIASPSPARTFTFELSPPESPQRSVEYNYAGNSQFPRPDFHRLETRPYGLRTEGTEVTEKSGFPFPGPAPTEGQASRE